MSDAPLPNDATPTPPSSPSDNHDHPANLGASSAADSAPTAATWQTVNFPDVLNVDRLQPLPDPDPSLPESATAPTAAIAAEVDDPVDDPIVVEPDWQPAAPAAEAPPEAISDSAQQSYDELVLLIHELNECNDALLARVQYLEEALAQSQRHYESTQVALVQYEQQTQQAQEVLQTVQLKLTHTTDELEFARQSVQRQDIRIETLEEQYDVSQQRVAELERECALVQQRYQEQTHQLQEEKAIAQDLQSRLQRQQRYTMQYKVALKKCMDVPPPMYHDGSGQTHQLSGTTSIAGLGAVDMMPSAPGIQPWSTQNRIAKPKFRWTPPGQAEAQADDLLQKDLWAAPIAATPDQSDPPSPELELDIPQTATTTDAEPPIADSDPDVLAALMSQPAAWPASAFDVEGLPLPDLLGEPETAAAPRPARDRSSISYSLRAEADQDAHQATADLIRDLEAPPAAAEDALWEDLARLIDASAEAGDGNDADATDDIVFEESHLDSSSFSTAGHSELERDQVEPANPAVAPQPQSDVAAAAPARSPADSGDSAWPSSPWSQPGNSPSPLVYPLRAQKRRTSLAAVELPSFPRPKAQVK